MPHTEWKKALRISLRLALAALACASLCILPRSGGIKEQRAGPASPAARCTTGVSPVENRTMGVSPVENRTTGVSPVENCAPPRSGQGRDTQPARGCALPDYWPQEPRPIALRYRTLLPRREPSGAAALRVDQKLVWLVQFGQPLEQHDVARLRARGVEILLPTVAGAFHARASPGSLSTAAKDFAPRILGWCRLRPEDKLLPAAKGGTRGWPKEALANSGQLSLRLELYPGADAQAVAAAVPALGGALRLAGTDWQSANGRSWAPASAGTASGGALEVTGPPDRGFVLRLAALEDVYAVDLPRPLKRVHNEEAAAAANITVLQAAPYNLTGTGITILVRDEGRAFAHPDLAGRLLFGPDTAALTATSQHSTHVAGTIGGTGLLRPSALARGMAPECTLVSFDLLGEDVGEVLQANRDFGAVISNHSYGFATGWEDGTFTDNQDTFGVYSSLARDWDGIALSGGLILVKSVGNSRNQSGPGSPPNGSLAPDGEYYGTTDASSTGKNILAVGGAADAARAGVPAGLTMALPSSSSGPCSDGRLRPELLANGDTLNSCNNSTVPNQEYVSLSGSSMACAVVSGATALFTEYYQRRFGSGAYPAPHYLRAVYAQTATDMGRPGPDYLHGFGGLDLSAVVSLFQTDSSVELRIASSSVSAATPERFYALYSDGVKDLKATLCWSDQPGDVLAAKAIVNDLDLRLVRVSDQAVFLPFVLDPAHPEQPATSALNSVDTIEQLVLSAPAAGSYLLAIRGSTLATAANFTLASSHALSEDLAPVPVIKPSGTMGMPPLLVTFDGSASNDPDGSLARYMWDFGDGVTAEGALVEHTYNAGSFRAVLTVVDNQGAAESASVVISVANQPPVAQMAVKPASGPAPLACVLSSAGSFDPDDAITSYRWDFGDGASADGAQAFHTYSAPGLYFATLTVTDVGNATGSCSQPVLAGDTLGPYSSRFSLNFRRLSSDSFSLSSRNAPVSPTLVSPEGLKGSVQIGALRYQFMLDAKGRYNVPPLRVKLVPKRLQITITISHANLQDALSAVGVQSSDVKHQIARVPFALALKDRVSGSVGLPYDYSARKGKTGAGRLIVGR